VLHVPPMKQGKGLKKLMTRMFVIRMLVSNRVMT